MIFLFLSVLIFAEVVSMIHVCRYTQQCGSFVIDTRAKCTLVTCPLLLSAKSPIFGLFHMESPSTQSPQIINYILASSCTVLFSGYYRLCLRLRVALLYVAFSLLDSFTTCFGLLGHFQVCTYTGKVRPHNQKSAKQTP
jgi:hypothetical protein